MPHTEKLALSFLKSTNLPAPILFSRQFYTTDFNGVEFLIYAALCPPSFNPTVFMRYGTLIHVTGAGRNTTHPWPQANLLLGGGRWAGGAETFLFVLNQLATKTTTKVSNSKQPKVWSSSCSPARDGWVDIVQVKRPKKHKCNLITWLLLLNRWAFFPPTSPSIYFEPDPKSNEVNGNLNEAATSSLEDVGNLKRLKVNLTLKKFFKSKKK